MSDNLRFWDKAKTPPKDALKKITKGRLAGMTDVNPAWRVMKMTEIFGPCGIGWRWQPVKKWTEQGSYDQVFAFVDVELFVNVDGAWSEPIPGTGGCKMVSKESGGLYSDDNAWKKATTDALSTAMKMIGIAADIYMGNDDGSKYREPKVSKQLMTKKQSDELIAFCTAEKLDPQDTARHYGISKKMTSDQFDNTFRIIKDHVETGEIGYRFAIPEDDKTDA